MTSTLLLCPLFSFIVLTHTQSLNHGGFSSSVPSWDATSTTIAASSSLASSIIISLPTLLPCSDPSWLPSPENWAAENVDRELANTKGLWGSGTTFVEYIAEYTGQPGQRCGIGQYSSCTVPDCTAFQNANGKKWLYFVAVSIVEMNNFFNIMNNGITDGTTELSLVVEQMANNFFPWEPSPSHTSIWPWIEATVSSVFSFIPFLLPVEIFNPGAAISQSAAAFTNGGLESLSAQTLDPEAYYLGSMQDLGTTFKTLSYNASVALDQWSQTLFDGKPDASGKTIIDYFAGGRFTLTYNISSPVMENFYFQTMVSDVVNDQWRSESATTRQFVMCTNGTAQCNNTSVYSEGGRTCCLYSLDTSEVGYVTPPGLNSLENSTFNINASSITAGSLHSYLAQGLNYNKSDVNALVEASLGGNSTKQAFNQGVAFQGIWTIPVCDVGENGNWVADYEVGSLPCCCGPLEPSGLGCKETNDFLNATHLIGFGGLYSKCRTQYPGFVGPSAAVGVRAPLMSSLFLSALVTVLLSIGFSA